MQPDRRVSRFVFGDCCLDESGHNSFGRLPHTLWPSDLEDDFNERAGAIFVEPKEICRYRIKCRATADKAWLTVEFYKSVDPAISVPSCI
jgi:hypothetical protein